MCVQYTHVEGNVVEAIKMLSGEEVSSSVSSLKGGADGRCRRETSPQAHRLRIISVHSQLARVTIILRSYEQPASLIGCTSGLPHANDSCINYLIISTDNISGPGRAICPVCVSEQ